LLTVYHSPTIFRAVEEMCKLADLPTPKIYMIPQEAPNICSVGRNARHSGLLFTEGILKSLDKEELRCAIAHELVHIYRRDTQVAVLAALFASFLGMGTTTAQSRASNESPSNNSEKRIGGLVFDGMMAMLAPIAATVVQVLVNIKRDFRADAYGAKLAGNPLAMANAIRTMEKKKHVTPMNVSPAVAHLFMVSPLRPGRIERMFTAHPSMVERIERLERMHASNRANISTTFTK
jgi:heat shock protein HtpX